MDVDGLIEVYKARHRADGLLQGILIDMMTSVFSRAGVFGETLCGKDILPCPIDTCLGILPFKGIGQIYTPVSFCNIGPMQ